MITERSERVRCIEYVFIDLSHSDFGDIHEGHFIALCVRLMFIVLRIRKSFRASGQSATFSQHHQSQYSL